MLHHSRVVEPFVEQYLAERGGRDDTRWGHDEILSPSGDREARSVTSAGRPPVDPGPCVPIAVPDEGEGRVPENGGDQFTVLELDHAPFEVVMEAPALPALRTPRSTIVTPVVVVDGGLKGLLDDHPPSRAERLARSDDGADGEGPPGPHQVPRHEVRGGCIAVDGIRLKLHGAAQVLLDPIDVERFPDDERVLCDLADHPGVEAHEPHVSGESGPSESWIQAAHEHLLPLWRHRP